jgi:hypothetical protein
MIGLSLLSSGSKHNMWSYYENIMIGLSLSSVSQHNMWSYYENIMIIDERQQQ